MPDDNSDDNRISTKLVGLGIPIGGLMGILASFVTEIEMSTAFSFGVAGGIITAALLATAIKKKGIHISVLRLTSLGMGFGTLVGMGMGFLMSWTFSETYLTGFSVGAIAGLLGGLLLGVLGGLLAKR